VNLSAGRLRGLDLWVYVLVFVWVMRSNDVTAAFANCYKCNRPYSLLFRIELYSLILVVVIYIALTLFKRQLKTVPFHHQTFCELSITI